MNSHAEPGTEEAEARASSPGNPFEDPGTHDMHESAAEGEAREHRATRSGAITVETELPSEDETPIENLREFPTCSPKAARTLGISY